jgi:putative spermidine/putrescine transport system substrate-binding protein
MRARVGRAVSGVAVLLVAACGQAATPPPAFTDFASAVEQARGQSVNLYAYGGDEGANRYLDTVLAPAARDRLGVTVNRVPVDDTATAMQKILGDKQAGKSSGGAVDLLWVNGENFRTGKQAGVWYCGWTELLPNIRYVDWSDPEVANDFGTPVEGCEMPWSKAQFAFVHDTARVPDPPRTMAGLLDWIEANPGRFTYPAPPDFTGSVFLRHVLYATAGGVEAVPAAYDQAAFDQVAPALYSALRGAAPGLWRGGETYPSSVAELNRLFADGEVDFTMTYGPAEVDTLVADGTYPSTTRAYVLDEGTIGNTSYLAIPANAANRAAAVAVADLALSPEQQVAKAAPAPWGAYPAIDLDRLDPAWRERFADLPRSPHVPPFAELSRNTRPELRAEWTAPLEEGWRREVLAR